MSHEIDTFPRLLFRHAKERPNVAAIREKQYGIWQVTTWASFTRAVRAQAAGLAAAGVRRGDHVAVIGANRPRLYAAMVAIQALGAIPVPLYQDAAAAEMVFPLKNAE